MNGRYILVGQTPVPCEDLLEWGEWMQHADRDRQVALTVVGEHRICTVFLGLDHRFMGKGPPILFETMIFCEHTPECELDEKMRRYSEWLDSEVGHQSFVTMVQKAESSKPRPDRTRLDETGPDETRRDLT